MTQYRETISLLFAVMFLFHEESAPEHTIMFHYPEVMFLLPEEFVAEFTVMLLYLAIMFQIRE